MHSLVTDSIANNLHLRNECRILREDVLLLSITILEIYMRESNIALFKNHKGTEEMRLYFPTWEVGGRTLRGVNILPHRCDPSVCEYGDHVHVGVYDDPDRIVGEGPTLTKEQEDAITWYLSAQLAMDALIYGFEEIINRPNSH